MRLLSGVIVAVAWSGVAHAAGGGLTIGASTSLTYDDNIFRLPDGVTRGTKPRSEWIVAPQLSVGYSRSLGRITVGVDAGLAYDFHRYNQRLNRERIDFSGNASGRVAFCDVGVNSSYSRGQSDLADLVGGGNFVNVESRLSGGVNLLCGSAIGLRPGVSYEHTIVRNSASVRKISDYNNDTVRVSLGYSRPSLGLISIYGALNNGYYPNRDSLVGSGLSDGTRTYSAGVSFSREIGTRLSGSVSVGYMKAEPRSNLIPGSKGLTYQANLSFKGSDRISGTLGLDRGTQQSNLLGVSYSVVTNYRATVNYSLNHAISLTGGARYTRRRFAPSVIVSSPITNGTDRTLAFNGGIRLRARDKIALSLDGTHTERKSHSGLSDYDANRVSLTATLNF